LAVGCTYHLIKAATASGQPAERSYVHFRTQPGRASLNGRLTEHAYHQKMGAERRQDKLRVRFSHPVPVWIMGIDGRPLLISKRTSIEKVR
jgi:hypothetical protein